METMKSVAQIALVKKSSTFKIIIPEKVERLIRFLCERVWDTEWSGVLFYNPTGEFEDGSLEIHCVDILPMDIGNATYTEFNMSPDVISYMAENPELLDCKMGLIHSHNNMSTFFSGTDTNTLLEEGKDRNHFVSLIVNNAGSYTAAITRKVKYKSIRELTYEGFSGTVAIPDKEIIEGEEVEYFPLDIVFEGEPNNSFNVVANRLAEIKKNKETSSFKGNATYSFSDKPTYIFDGQNLVKQPTLFDNTFSDDLDTKNKNYSHVTNKASESVTNELIESIINQLITGSVTVTKLDADSRKKLIDTLTVRFNKRFGKEEEGLKLFEYWANDFVEFLLWYSTDSLSEDTATEIADKTIEILKRFPKSKYIDVYINLLLTYATSYKC